MNLTVHDDTRRQKDLADRITRILESVAPLVARTTGLPLPPAVRFRVVTPAEWRHETVAYLKRLLVRDTITLGLTQAQLAPLRHRIRATAVATPLVWPLVAGWTAWAADGQWETLVVPQALRHTGLLAHEPSLTQMLSHELTHHLQAEAYGDDPAWNTLLPQLRKADETVTKLVLEGHAHWTDQQVTTLIYGRPINHHREAHRSLRYWLHDNPLTRTFGPPRMFYAMGAALIGQAVTAHGVDHVNRIWQDRTLLPTQDEFTDATAWIRRIAP